MEIAEAAKVIENTQRDINIALMNELAIVFDKLGLDTSSVLEAAGTKWNFLPFHPGLVGGHCIGVDPYYLTHRATQVGHEPKVIIAGRQINEHMPLFILQKIKDKISSQNKILKGQNVLVLGLSFKENCPDFRNSKVFEVIQGLLEEGSAVDAHDPEHENLDLATIPYLSDAKHFKLLEGLEDKQENYDIVLLAVPHYEYLELGEEYLKRLAKSDSIFFDLRSVFPNSGSTLRL